MISKQVGLSYGKKNRMIRIEIDSSIHQSSLKQYFLLENIIEFFEPCVEAAKAFDTMNWNLEFGRCGGADEIFLTVHYNTYMHKSIFFHGYCKYAYCCVIV